MTLATPGCDCRQLGLADRDGRANVAEHIWPFRTPGIDGTLDAWLVPRRRRRQGSTSPGALPMALSLPEFIAGWQSGDGEVVEQKDLDVGDAAEVAVIGHKGGRAVPEAGGTSSDGLSETAPTVRVRAR